MDVCLHIEIGLTGCNGLSYQWLNVRCLNRVTKEERKIRKVGEVYEILFHDI